MISRLTLVAIVAGVFAGLAGAEDTKHVLLIGSQPDHPPGTHRYLPTCRLLAHCLGQTPGVEATVSDGWPADWPAERAIDAIVLYRAPFAKEIFNGPDAREIRRRLDAGAGLVTLHWATGVDRKDWDQLAGPMTRYQGGVWMSRSRKVRIGESPLHVLQAEHALNRGAAITRLRDEWYLDPELGPNAAPQWEIETEGERLTVAWTYDRPDGGRTFATTLGHFWSNFAREPFRRAIVNGILWSARVDTPAEGAPVEVTAELTTDDTVRTEAAAP